MIEPKSKVKIIKRDEEDAYSSLRPFWNETGIVENITSVGLVWVSLNKNKSVLVPIENLEVQFLKEI